MYYQCFWGRYTRFCMWAHCWIDISCLSFVCEICVIKWKSYLIILNLSINYTFFTTNFFHIHKVAIFAVCKSLKKKTSKILELQIFFTYKNIFNFLKSFWFCTFWTMLCKKCLYIAIISSFSYFVGNYIFYYIHIKRVKRKKLPCMAILCIPK